MSKLWNRGGGSRVHAYIGSYVDDVYRLSLNAGGTWARSTSPHLLMLADWDADDELIGVSFAGPLAHMARDEGALSALDEALSPEMLDSMEAVEPGMPVVDDDEVGDIRARIAAAQLEGLHAIA